MSGNQNNGLTGINNDEWMNTYRKVSTEDQVIPTLKPAPQFSLKLEPKGWLDLLEKLADLKKAGLLIVDDNFKLGILTILSKVNPKGENGSLIDNYIEVLRAEFQAFKTQLSKQGINTQNYTENFSANQLIFRIPSPTHYDRFAAQLQKQNLLLLELKNRVEIEPEEEESVLGMSPFEMVPRPKGARKKK